ncbi:alpha-glucosidase/alpha-galactosidase [Candidatus Puniceispirillum marinum]|uniref:Glycoside hydrolase family 4 n=1 Tax=Puniceispirillum marinum (strain IMCC1322) TaxID=488538 RepID=D5BT42_PUNMI|nr:alpha-glucosidase/alpha-galactosidase [Candidatus Puniceispirillum marinum]ADE39439.1 glycoside hydrolase family 4 [Candidatus Puniceispirillum marinum IMCC1322]
MIKITMIGAGSTVFMQNILTDVLLEDCFKNCHVALQDIDEKRLKTSQLVAEKISATVNAKPTITATTDRRTALQGADFVIIMIQVGGYKPSTVIDFEIPATYGLTQTIADTLGVGGVMRGLRTVPVLAEIARDMMDICPDALMLQYVNPMAINCLALSRMVPDLRYVGLCHSVQGTAIDLARDLGESIDDIEFECAGINHVAFYTKFAKRHADGRVEDLYPRLHKLIDGRNYGANYDGCTNHVRYEMLRRLGYFVTESSEHFAEYTPWFIKNDQPELIKQFDIPINEYIRRCEDQIEKWDAQEQALLSDSPIICEKSVEYAARIINAVVNDVPDTINGNVLNDGLIGNLPANACVEVPCIVDKRGITPQSVDDLPPHLAAIMQSSINVQSLTVEAIITGKKEHVYHAVMMDPHTGAELNLDQIWQMVDELLDAHAGWLPALR